MKTIDLTPTWGEWGNIFYRFAVSGERKPVESLHPDFAKAFSAAQAFSAIQNSLTAEQLEKADAVFRAEMAKQGFPTKQEGAAS
jgi:hypothetical protein